MIFFMPVDHVKNPQIRRVNRVPESHQELRCQLLRTDGSNLGDVRICRAAQDDFPKGKPKGKLHIFLQKTPG